ncbi:hypothetical protein [Sinorhizobium meliloti]|uniref:hypothetical protein n=1 Tax=Rhizobium meliloti TaxID=382 RepID=UPI0020BFB13F|nr:hypothetical protein [Sinorhizobium meliloti]
MTAPDVPTSLIAICWVTGAAACRTGGEMTIRGDATIEDEGGRRPDGFQCLNGGVHDDGWHNYDPSDKTLQVGRILVW